MGYRGFVFMIVAAGVSLNSAALANPHCRVGTIYYRSKHTCLAKEVAIDRGIYHYWHDIAAKPDGTTIAYRGAQALAVAPAAAIPVQPIPLAHNGTAPARNENVVSIGSIVPPAPEIARRSMWPYGALLPVTPIE
jgi:hypothetical protein